MKLTAATVPAVLALFLSGCSAPIANSLPPSPLAMSSSTIAASSPPTTETPSSTPTSEGVTFSISCETDDGDNAFSTWQEAWDSPYAKDLAFCDASIESGASLSAAQETALKAAGREDPDEITDLAALCSDVTGDYATGSGTFEDAENYDDDGATGLADVRGMMILCPDFPRAKTLTARIAATVKTLSARKKGTRFDDDSHRVGKEIKSGTYVAHPDDDGCYWERLDRKGNILANNFVGGTTRVQATIRSSDYTFHSERCGTWQRR